MNALRTATILLLLLTARMTYGADAPPDLVIPSTAVPPPITAAADAGPWSAAAVVRVLQPSINPDRATDPVLPATTIRLLWDARFLYVRFECRDEHLYTPFSTRDATLYQGDVCEVFLDPIGDHRQWTELQVAPNGAVFDSASALTADPRSDAHGKLLMDVYERDLWSWAGFDLAGLQTAAGAIPGGWCVDLAIPASAFQRLGGQPWHAGQRLRGNLVRHDWTEPDADGKRQLIAMYWARVVDGCPHISPQAMGIFTLGR